MKRKWYLLLIAGFLAVAAGLFCFRDSFLIRVFPRAVLTKAITASFDHLEERFADSPIHTLAGGLDPKLRQSVSMTLDTTTKLAGVVHYDLLVNTQTSPNRISAGGSVTYGGKTMDLALYLDEKCGAISSQNLTDGNFYGLTFASFSEDIRSFMLLRMLLGEEVLGQWDASVSDIAKWMNGSYALPEWTVEDLRLALLGALALKPQVSAANDPHCYIISFQLAGDQIGELSGQYRDQIPDEILPAVDALVRDGCVEIVFLLEKTSLSQITCTVQFTEERYCVQVTLADALDIQFIAEGPEGIERTNIVLLSESDQQTYRETITCSRTVNAVQSQWSAVYAWDLVTGDMDLNVTKDGKKHPIRLNLRGEGESFTIICQEFEKILNLFSGKENLRTTICTLTVTPGGSVAGLSQYRNLSEWSLEDFYLLVTNFGGLIGLKMS